MKGVSNGRPAPRKQRKRIKPEKRSRIYARDDYRCQYCGCEVDPKRNASLDHVVPIAEGGSNKQSNLVTSCAKCNNAKGDGKGRLQKRLERIARWKA